MLEVIVKYGVLMCCSLFVFSKLLHIKIQTKTVYKYLIFLLFALPIIYLVRIYAMSLSIIAVVLLLVLFSIKVIQVDVNLSLTSTVISLGIAYLAFLIATAFISVFLHAYFSRNIGFFNWITIFLISAVQVLFVLIPFRFKRLKNGMPFLIEHGTSDIGVYISTTLLIAASFLSMNKNDDLFKIIPVIIVLISGLIIWFWWRKSLTKKYFDKIKAQEIQALQDTISQREAEVERLKQHNNELSKIIHKDNKLIPALEYAVRQYLLTAEAETDSAARLKKGMELLSQIEGASRERTGIIASYESSSKSLPKTGVASVDSLLMYMFQKSKEQQIDFNLSVSGSVKYLVENIAAEQDINTLLADLIENAIIATKSCAPRNILVHIGITDNCYSISIFDNGLAFTPETINDIGLKRTTTHAGEGGSGIGLITTFEILKRYQASFVIEDIADNVLYTKKVTVSFDNSSQFRIKSAQINDYTLIAGREDIIFTRDIGA